MTLALTFLAIVLLFAVVFFVAYRSAVADRMAKEAKRAHLIRQSEAARAVLSVQSFGTVQVGMSRLAIACACVALTGCVHLNSHIVTTNAQGQPLDVTLGVLSEYDPVTGVVGTSRNVVEATKWGFKEMPDVIIKVIDHYVPQESGNAK